MLLNQNIYANIDIHGGDSVYVYFFGCEECMPGHTFGPAIRDYHILHLATSGKGSFEQNGHISSLQAGQGFFIFPEQVTIYKADLKDPWKYYWLALRGPGVDSLLSMTNITIENPVFNYTGDNYLHKMLEAYQYMPQLKLVYQLTVKGLFHYFWAQMVASNPPNLPQDIDTDTNNHYIQKAKDYIRVNYYKKLSISELANHIGLNVSYLGDVFKQETGLSMKKYLTQYRIKKACDLLANPAFSIGEIARSVGYDDPLMFSKVFHREKGSSPRDYRQKASNLFIKKRE